MDAKNLHFRLLTNRVLLVAQDPPTPISSWVEQRTVHSNNEKVTTTAEQTQKNCSPARDQ
jgi:hypothetical protein